MKASYALVKAMYLDHGPVACPKDLFLAWLDFHRDFGGHPDDYLVEDGPYCGWHVLLTRDILELLKPIDEESADHLFYAGFFGTFMSYTLPMLKSFHADDEEPDFQHQLSELEALLMELSLDGLERVCSILDGLVQFHDGSPKEVFENLCDASGVFAWVKAYEPRDSDLVGMLAYYWSGEFEEYEREQCVGTPEHEAAKSLPYEERYMQVVDYAAADYRNGIGIFPAMARLAKQFNCDVFKLV